MNLKFSANIGFLWEHLPLTERIIAAGRAGFDAVECHFPYDVPANETRAALEATNLPMIGINTSLGPENSKLFGVAALPDYEELAHQYIDQAIEYAAAIGAKNINVVAGVTDGRDKHEQMYRKNLKYACERAQELEIGILIEPLNPRSVPGSHLSQIEQAISTIEALNIKNLKLMFDVFHTQIVQGDLVMLLSEHIKHIGHVQISAVHDRGEPDVGEVNFPYVLNALENLGYQGYVGAEYKPRGDSVEQGLSHGWKIFVALNAH